MKSVMGLTTLIYELDPEFDLVGVQNRFFTRLISGEIRSYSDPRQLALAMYEYGFRMRRMMNPREWSAESNQSLQFSVARVRRRITALTTGILGTAFVFYLYTMRPITHFLERNYHHNLRWLPPTLALIYAVLTIAIVMQGRKLRRALTKRRGRVDRAALRKRWERP
jgi:hypothetical protein